ncbi:bifunctional phosphopantothenoylcysteine decarboxylase/phosphopantothenate--cysteine ligase CoaBC [Acetobacteraceae bacterium]|nr:bifunctional phosphopantothenoylcysteine decarboxylase/phosphopantothenate--cysteine ligase CoaBC [Acetobacteraceae bacterium]
MHSSEEKKNILLIVSGSIAAYRSLELIRLLTKKYNISVFPVLSKGGEYFVTPLSLQALSGNQCLTPQDWFTTGMTHILLSRKVDLILVCPASANFISRIANGMADELATSLILSAKVPILIAPAMNPEMWQNPATQDNINLLLTRKITVISPEKGLVACGEYGVGRLAELSFIESKIKEILFDKKEKKLKGKRALVTAGPTQESFDPIRFITNHASGKQGYALAEALAQAGATVTLISGPTALPSPKGIEVKRITTAIDMEKAVKNSLPADIFVSTAAVADWRPEFSSEKIKKNTVSSLKNVQWHENPDILKNICHSSQKPKLTIGFAAETTSLIENAVQKLKNKNCDWVIANNVKEGVFNSSSNTISFISARNIEHWPKMTKIEVAELLVKKIISFFD